MKLLADRMLGRLVRWLRIVGYDTAYIADADDFAIMRLARAEDLPDYDPEMVDDAALRALVRQSYFSTGPQNARELLNRWGIHLIVLRHLPRTYLDGASFLASDRVSKTVRTFQCGSPHCRPESPSL